MKTIDEAKTIHDKLREILIKYGSPEHGDCILDEISEAVGIPPTTSYYDEQC